MKLQDKTNAITKQTFEPGQVKKLVYSLLSDEQISDFEINCEFNMCFTLASIG